MPAGSFTVTPPDEMAPSRIRVHCHAAVDTVPAAAGKLSLNDSVPVLPMRRPLFIVGGDVGFAVSANGAIAFSALPAFVEKLARQDTLLIPAGSGIRIVWREPDSSDTSWDALQNVFVASHPAVMVGCGVPEPTTHVAETPTMGPSDAGMLSVNTNVPKLPSYTALTMVGTAVGRAVTVVHADQAL